MLTSTEIVQKLAHYEPENDYSRMLYNIVMSSVSQNKTLAAKRLLALLEESDLKALMAGMYAKVTIPRDELQATASLQEIFSKIHSHKNLVNKVFSMLDDNMPQDTAKLIQDYLHAAYPVTYVNTVTYVLVAELLNSLEDAE